MSNDLEREEYNRYERRPERNNNREVVRFLIKLLVSSIAVIITSYLLPGVQIHGFLDAVVVAFVVAILNALLKPILVILTIPVTVMSLGLFLLVINAFIIQIAAHFVPGFTVSGFWSALFFSIILSLITWVLELPGKSRPPEK